MPQGGARRIELVGEYDLSQITETAALFDALSPDGPATIDMTRVSYVDSSFLKELVKLRARLIPHRITLLVGQENVRRLLRIVKFEMLFEIQASPEGPP
jgi:anti-anti-sigma regulatory factor